MSDAAPSAATPSTADFFKAAEPQEQRAVQLSLALFIVATLAWPHLLSWLCSRPLPSGVGDFLRDLVIVELIALPLMLLWPLKTLLKKWLHVGDKGALHVVVTGLWVGGLSVAAAWWMPAAFFHLTGRVAASTTSERLHDGGWFLVSALPQVVALLPYIWATRRIHQRLSSTVDA